MGDLKESLEQRFRRADELEEVFYKEIFMPFKARIYYHVYRKLKTIEPTPDTTSEELTGNTLTKAWRQICKRIPINEAWIFKVANNEVINHIKLKGITELQKTESIDKPLDNRKGVPITKVDSIANSKSKTPEEEILNRELADQIDKGLQRVSALQRNSFILHDGSGYKYSEVAEILCTSSENAKDAAHRARIALKAHLEGYLGDKRTNLVRFKNRQPGE